MKIILTLSIIALTLFTGTGLSALDAPSEELRDFKIVIENTDDGIKLEGLKGSAWSELAFGIRGEQSKAIDEFGMKNLDEKSTYTDSGLADFLFSLTKTKNSIMLKGIEGTAWTDLSFYLPVDKKQAIDQFGMTSLN